MTTRVGLRMSRLVLSRRCGRSSWNVASSLQSRRPPGTSTAATACWFSSHDNDDDKKNNDKIVTDEPPPTKEPLPFTSKSLGLWKPLVRNHVDQLAILDEVSSTWKETNHKKAIANLERAAEIFADHKTGGPEHCGALAMLAQRRILLGRIGGRKESGINTIRTLLELQSIQLDNPHVLFALAKAMVEVGDLVSALEVSKELLNLETVQKDPVLWACSIHLKVAAWTMKMKMENTSTSEEEDQHGEDDQSKKDDKAANADKREEATTSDGDTKGYKAQEGTTTKDGDEMDPEEEFLSLHKGLRQEAETVQRDHPRLAAVLYNTLGIMESESVKPSRDFGWGKESSSFLTALKLAKQRKELHDVRLQATILVNHGWFLLDNAKSEKTEKEEKEHMERASSLGSEALKLVERPSPEVDVAEHEFCLGRTLSLLATLYAKTGNAISSEGLFQTSIDLLDKGSGSMNAIATINAYDQYAKLLRSWDRRGGDAERIEKHRDTIKISDDSFWSLQYPIVAGVVLPVPCDIDTYRITVTPRYDYVPRTPLKDDEIQF